MDDARPLGVLPALGLVREQAVDERARPVAGARVDDDTGRLVHDEKVLVLPDDVERHLLRFQVAAAARLHGHLELLAAGESEALGARRPVHEDVPGLDEALGLGAGADLRQPGEEAVEPRARGLAGRGTRPLS